MAKAISRTQYELCNVGVHAWRTPSKDDDSDRDRDGWFNPIDNDSTSQHW